MWSNTVFFDISSQSKLKLRSKQRIRMIVKNLCMLIDHLHDGVIVLQLPFILSVSYVN